MSVDIDELIQLFREHGGIFENMTVGHKRECGYYCEVIDSEKPAKVFCPKPLLVDIDDIGITVDGLFVSKPDKYASNIGFLDAYFSFHFGRELVAELIKNKRNIDSLSDTERTLLETIDLPVDYPVGDGENDDLVFVKRQIFDSHQFGFSATNKDVLMPFVTLLNFGLDGAPYDESGQGIGVSGMFKSDVCAYYNMDDVLMHVTSYGFVSDTRFIYSLPMRLDLPDGQVLVVNRDLSRATKVENGFRWPVVEMEGNEIIISWFPLYFKFGPMYPARVAASIGEEYQIPSQLMLQEVYRYNLAVLLPLVFGLGGSTNSYAKLVLSGVERQLELIAGIKA